MIKILILIATWAIICPAPSSRALDADQLVEKSFDYVRGKASVSTVKMTIQRPTWEREMIIMAWTRGQTDSLFYIDSPPKDHGNGTLKKGREMWMYNPKVNRVIKVPPSMMSQSWMGSDFSNNDLSKSDALLTDYTHSIEEIGTHEGLKVYVIKSMPKPDAPVVWGMQKLKVREDLIWLSQEFFDEDLKLVKYMTTLKIQRMDDRLFPKIWRMQKADETDRYTQLEYMALAFHTDLPENVFTLANLRKPRR